LGQESQKTRFCYETRRGVAREGVLIPEDKHAASKEGQKENPYVEGRQTRINNMVDPTKSVLEHFERRK